MQYNLMTKQQKISIEQKNLFTNRKVVQLNKFIKGDVTPFTVNDLKIFKLIISKVDSKDSLFQDFYEISTDEIKHLNINEKHLYSETKKSLKRLANIYLTFDEGNSIREVGLIRNDFKFEKFSKKVLVNFNDDMGEYLINLKKNFFMYDLIDIVNFKYKHTLKLYEYFKSQSLNVIKLNIDTLKNVLDLENKYNRYTNFKKDVIEVIVDEINTCSNSLFLKFSEEKKGAKVEQIVFHVTRINTDTLIGDKLNEQNTYSYLESKECKYLDKYYTFKSVDINNFVIILQEQYSNNETNIVCEDRSKLENQLKILFPKDFKEGKNEQANDEVIRLSAIKDFKKFKTRVIEEYRGKEIANYVPEFNSDTIFSIDADTGYIFNKTEDRILSKDESIIVWKYLFNNKDKVGQIITTNIERNVKDFINQILFITTKDSFGNQESIKYAITQIEEVEDAEGIIKYRMHIQNAEDPSSKVEKSKTLLTYDEIVLFIEKNSIEKHYVENE